jgi:hypothetical protein
MKVKADLATLLAQAEWAICKPARQVQNLFAPLPVGHIPGVGENGRETRQARDEHGRRVANSPY